jgi:Flp pilus assembly protein TadD/predicted aspartyl protease
MVFGVRVLTVVLAMAAAVAFLPGLSRPVTASSEVQLQLADLLLADGRYAEALEAYRLAKATPDTALRTRALVGVVKTMLRLGDFQPALQEAAELRGLAPRDSEVLALHGDALWAGGLFEESDAAYQDALAIAPETPRARHGLGRSLAAQNRLASALDEVQASLRGAPAEPDFHYTLASLYERARRFDDAAASMMDYINLIPNKDVSDKAAWAKAQVRFLRSFEGKKPFAMERGDDVHVIPFRIVRDKVMVEGRINGGSPVEFVLDTGAEQTVLSLPMARRAAVVPITYVRSAGVGEVGIRGLQIGRLDSLEFGRLKVRNLTVLIKNPPLTGLPTSEMESFSPLALGLSMVVDYKRRQLIVAKNLPAADYDTSLPMRLYRLAMVRGTLNGEHPASFVVDTGGEVISISQASAGLLEWDPVRRRIPLKVYGSSGWDPDAFLLPGVDLQFASIRFSNIPVVVLNLRVPSVLLGFELGGIVGHRFLKDYRVGIDLENSLLRLKAE